MESITQGAESSYDVHTRPGSFSASVPLTPHAVPHSSHTPPTMHPENAPLCWNADQSENEEIATGD